MLLKAAIGIVGVLALLVGGVFGVGALLPRDHVARGETLIRASPERVAALIGDPAGYAAWRGGVAISHLRREGETLLWREARHGDAVDYAMTVESPGRWRSTIVSQGLPYGGYWIIELVPEGDGVRVRITEHGFVDNLAFRTLGRFVFGQDTTLKAWLRDLKGAVG